MFSFLISLKALIIVVESCSLHISLIRSDIFKHYFEKILNLVFKMAGYEEKDVYSNRTMCWYEQEALEGISQHEGSFDGRQSGRRY